jgi:hypothetical protein
LGDFILFSMTFKVKAYILSLKYITALPYCAA